MNSATTDHRVEIIKALAHPARLEIAHILSTGEHCVTDLQNLVGGDLSTVSKHLTIMRRAGWIDCEKRSQQVFYRLACNCLADFMQCIESIASHQSRCDC